MARREKAHFCIRVMIDGWGECMSGTDRSKRSPEWNELLLVLASLAWLFLMPAIATKKGTWAGSELQPIVVVGGLFLPVWIPVWIVRISLRRKLRWAFVASILVLLMYVLTILLPFFLY